MNLTRTIVGGLALGGVLLGPAAPLGAEELRAALSAPLILNLLALPTETPGAAFRESLREVPSARAEPQWEMLPDGNARFGTPALHVIVKNPCPGHTPVALPGRSPR
ncbi:MAG: hypothetical protein HY215_08030 [Candidatus Rokubacteria bacterium]|nr:hypothetical protein [Candidatus Rokubacteria bacterium]